MNRMQGAVVLMLICSLLLGGCTGSVPQRVEPGPTLPPAAAGFEAPGTDSLQDYPQTVQLCLPSAVDGQLIMLPERILLPPDRHPAEATIGRLLAFSGDERASSLPGTVPLQLYPEQGLELSGDVATVNLGANALLLSRQDLYTVSRAITNTLTQWRDIRYVNLLVAGAQAGIDEAGTLPFGSLQYTRNEDAPALWDSLSARAALETSEKQRFSSVCTLYFPAAMGRGILSEARTVSFPGQTRQQMLVTLLSALSAGAQTLPQLPTVPDLGALLAQQPQVHTADDGSVWASLDFLPIANETFISAGIPRSIMLASLCYTLTTFIPGLDGISVRIGNEQIEAIVPSGIYQGAGEQILFSDGILRRADFKSFLLTDCTLYFASTGSGLIRLRRPVPFSLAYSKRYLLEQLMLGPQTYDSLQGAGPVFPAAIGGRDLLGVAKDGDTALINFSGSLLRAVSAFTPIKERQLLYAMVNTLLENKSLRRVRFFIDGAQPETLSGAIYLPGEFLMDPDIVED
ncbi:MAG: GerMN domain-containing protein [Christensenellales bacterium]